MCNDPILWLIDLPACCPGLFPSPILAREYHAGAVVGDIELFGGAVGGDRTICSQTFHGVDGGVQCFRVEGGQGLGEI